MGIGITGDMMIEGVNVSKQIRESNGHEKSIKEKMVDRLKLDCKTLMNTKIPRALENILDEKGANTYRNLTRALADNIKLIEEYEWKLMYSEYETGDNLQKQVAVWEQNCDGVIRNHKVWDIEKTNNSFRVDGRNITIKNGIIDMSILDDFSKLLKDNVAKSVDDVLNNKI